VKLAVAFLWYTALASGPAWASSSSSGVILESTTDETVILESTTDDTCARWFRPNRKPERTTSTTSAEPLSPADFGWWIALANDGFATIVQLLLR
jgi:hypothetical protein